jgi:hypothetical protein
VFSVWVLTILSYFVLLYRQYHQEIEEFVSNLAKRFEEQQKNDSEKTSFNLSPQVSNLRDFQISRLCFSLPVIRLQDPWTKIKTIVKIVWHLPSFQWLPLKSEQCSTWFSLARQKKKKKEKFLSHFLNSF